MFRAAVLPLLHHHTKTREAWLLAQGVPMSSAPTIKQYHCKCGPEESSRTPDGPIPYYLAGNTRTLSTALRSGWRVGCKCRFFIRVETATPHVAEILYMEPRHTHHEVSSCNIHMYTGLPCGASTCTCMLSVVKRCILLSNTQDSIGYHEAQHRAVTKRMGPHANSAACRRANDAILTANGISDDAVRAREERDEWTIAGS